MVAATRLLPLPVIVLACLLLFAPATASGRAQQLVSHGGYAVTREGRLLEARALATAFVPASTIKLVTGLAALDILGPDYRFTTTFFVEGDTLYIRGSGDPGLTSATVAAIAADLARLGLAAVGDIALDADAFALSGKADGTEDSANPYDTANSALAVNYNAVAITVAADGRISSGEAETPLLPIMTEIGRRLGPGTHRVNPGAFAAAEGLSPTLRYCGELFTVMLERQGITVGGRIIAAAAPPGAKPLHTHTSPQTVADLVRACLHYSSNYIANQLFLACGAHELGSPATWDKGRRALQAYIAATWPQHRRALTLVEGSGLSRRTRITPGAMIAVLHSFKPYAALLKTKNGVPLKTGSLSGVHCYAGYFRRADDLDPFVILLNQPDNTRDQLLARLQRLHSAPRSTVGRK